MRRKKSGRFFARRSKKLFGYEIGFTLIELMVAMAIIAVLAVVSIVVYAGSQAKARDARRKAELKQVQAALEAYYSDHHAYPLSEPNNFNNDYYGGWQDSTEWFWTNTAQESYCTDATKCIGTLKNGYIKTLPLDPINIPDTTSCNIPPSTKCGKGGPGTPDTTNPSKNTGYWYTYWTLPAGDAGYCGAVSGQFYILAARMETDKSAGVPIFPDGSSCGFSWPGWFVITSK